MFNWDDRAALVGWHEFSTIPTPLSLDATRGVASRATWHRLAVEAPLSAGENLSPMRNNYSWRGQSFRKQKTTDLFLPLLDVRGRPRRVKAQYAALVDVGPIAARRSAFMSVGGFDEAFSYPGLGAIFFDFELSLRCWIMGWSVLKYGAVGSGISFPFKCGDSWTVRHNGRNGNKSLDVLQHVTETFRLRYRPWFDNISNAVTTRNERIGAEWKAMQAGGKAMQPKEQRNRSVG